MVGIRNNRRAQYTKRLIEETVLSLLQDKSIDTIKITEICKIADINRTTFYRYYDDVYDCINKIETEFFETEFKNKQINKMIETNPLFGLESLLTGFYNNPKLSNLVFVEGQTELLDNIYDFMDQEHPQKDGINKYQKIFIMNGMQAVMKIWVKNGMEETPKELTKIIWQIVMSDNIHQEWLELKAKNKWQDPE